MSTLFLDFVGAATVRVDDAPPELDRHLRSRVPLFFRDALPDGVPPAVHFRSASAQDLAGWGDWEVDAPYGMVPALHQARRAVACRYRGAVDLVLVPGEPIEVLFRRHRKCAGRLYGALLVTLHLALRRRGALLVHAAAVADERRCLLLAGLRGSRKTQILLTLLRDGWGYLADDKVILSSGRVHLFQTLVGLADHHLASLPWLGARSRKGASGVGRKVRTTVATLSAKLLPRQLLPAASKVLDPGAFLDVHDLFPGCPGGRERAVDAVALLGPGDALAAAPCGRAEAIQELAGVQEMFFHDLDPLDRLLAHFSPSAPPPIAAVLDAALPSSVAFFRVGLPARCAVDEAARLVALLR